MNIDVLRKLSGIKRVDEDLDFHNINNIINTAKDMYVGMGLDIKERKFLLFVACYLIFLAGTQYQNIVYGIIALIFW